MSRAERKLKSEILIQVYAELFRRRLMADIGYDIRSEIDREKDARKRGAMLAAERQVYGEMKQKIERMGG